MSADKQQNAGGFKGHIVELNRASNPAVRIASFLLWPLYLLYSINYLVAWVALAIVWDPLRPLATPLGVVLAVAEVAVGLWYAMDVLVAI